MDIKSFKSRINGLSSVWTAHMNHTVVMKRGTALVNP